MKSPPPEHVAQSLHSDGHSKLAVDLLRACGYTKRAALKALMREGRS